MDSLHILVVDDEETTLKSMVLVLEQGGHKVTSVGSAEGALDLMAGKKGGEKQFDFMLFDIHMPGMTGPQLLAEMEQRGLRLPSLAITGQASEEAAAVLQEMGCHILQKPFHGPQLLERISTILLPPQQFPDF